MKKSLYIILAVLLAAMLALSGCGGKTAGTPSQTPAAAAPAGDLTVKVLDIGQGDAILIKAAGQVILVDTGDIPMREKLVALLKKENVTAIDKVIITHPHADHLGGMPGVLDNFKVAAVYDSGRTATTSLYKQYLGSIKSKNIKYEIVSAGKEIPISNEIKLKVLAPDASMLNDPNLNNSSIVVKLMYNQFSMLLTGDAEKESEAKMISAYGAELKSDVLKSGHHGSNTSSSPEFLKAVSPKAAVVSLGANNDYHHPHPSTLKKYKDHKIDVLRTDLNGTVTITSDGKGYKIIKEKE